MDVKVLDEFDLDDCGPGRCSPSRWSAESILLLFALVSCTGAYFRLLSESGLIEGSPALDISAQHAGTLSRPAQKGLGPSFTIGWDSIPR